MMKHAVFLTRTKLQNDKCGGGHDEDEEILFVFIRLWYIIHKKFVENKKKKYRIASQLN